MPARMPVHPHGRTPGRVVLDTNVIISAALSPDGAPAQVVTRLLRHGRIVFCDATFDELRTRLWKPKFDRYLSLELRQALLHDLSAAADWSTLPGAAAGPTTRYSRDVDDDKFVHLALAGGCAWLVSGDRDLLDLAPLPGLELLNPAQALALLGPEC